MTAISWTPQDGAPARGPLARDRRARRRRLASGSFWRNASPEFRQAVERHNRRVASRLQRLFQKLVLVYLAGPLVFLLLHVLLRVRVEGRAEAMRALRGGAILAFRHFFEWDPLVTVPLAVWPATVARPALCPVHVAGHAWVRTRLGRAVSTILGVLALRRGGGPSQLGLARAADVLARGRGDAVAIYPTGPIGQATRHDVEPAVGLLALRCPDVPVVPVSVAGVRDLRLGDVLRLRRPAVRIRFGRPIRGREEAGAGEAAAERIGERIVAEWARLEASEASA